MKKCILKFLCQSLFVSCTAIPSFTMESNDSDEVNGAELNEKTENIYSERDDKFNDNKKNESKKVVCSRCNKPISKASISTHLKKCQGNKKLVCTEPTCDFSTFIKTEFKDHVKSEHDKTVLFYNFYCKPCDKYMQRKTTHARNKKHKKNIKGLEQTELSIVKLKPPHYKIAIARRKKNQEDKKVPSEKKRKKSTKKNFIKKRKKNDGINNDGANSEPFNIEEIFTNHDVNLAEMKNDGVDGLILTNEFNSSETILYIEPLVIDFNKCQQKSPFY